MKEKGEFMELLDKLNIKPNDEKLYIKALTHTSYSNEHLNESYERLEFLGDAVLELVLSDYLYKEKHLEEGTMTKMRSCYVCEAACCTYAKKVGLDKYILLGSGEPEANTTILADVFESFLGAMYLDQGLDVVKKFVINTVLEYIENKVNFLHDYKSELQEQVQMVHKVAVYEIVNEEGPAHDKVFTCQVKVDDIIMGIGSGTSKKAAEQVAAREALKKQIKV